MKQMLLVQAHSRITEDTFPFYFAIDSGTADRVRSLLIIDCKGTRDIWGIDVTDEYIQEFINKVEFEEDGTFSFTFKELHQIYWSRIENLM